MERQGIRFCNVGGGAGMKITIESDDGRTTYIYDKVWNVKFEEGHIIHDVKGSAIARECTITFKQTLVRNDDEHI